MRQKNKIVLFSVLAVFALFTVIAVPSVSATYPANAIYLLPENSNGVYCENNTLVEVWVNASVVTTGVQTSICFDPTCVNITDVDFTGGAWPPLAPPGWTHWGDHVTLIGTNLAGEPAGDKLFATIRLHCVKESWCISDLEFRNVNVLDLTPAPIDITLHNGTFRCPGVEKPDLNVTSININPTCSKVVDEIFVNESNEICAVIHNDGPGDVTEPFDVCFDANGVSISCVNVAGPLEAGNNVTVCINWTPNCTDYPVSTLYPVYSGIPVTLNVTADCNCTDCPTCPTGGKIDEVDEYNNTLSKDTFVYNNGYKSKNFDCNLTEEPLTLFEEDQFYGGVVYNVSGTKNYPFDPDETDTRVHHIDIPAGMTVKKARLYVYWYDYWGNPPPGCLANLSVNFSGTIVPLDAAYTDQKGFGTYNTPKGTYAYDVTPQVTPGSNDYTVIVTNIDPTNQTTLLGEMLLVAYEYPDVQQNQDPDEQQNHIHLWIMEGCDYLMASHGTYQYCVDVNESTATVTFPGPIPPAATGARLITVVSQGLADGANKLFNGNIVHTNAWNDMPASKINVDEEVLDVSQLVPADNTVGFQDTGTNGMQASNAILILEKEVVEKPDLNVTSININPTCSKVVDEIFVNESNEICAVIHNDGPGDVTEPFDVCFAANGVNISCVNVAGGLPLHPCENVTVCINWTPNCTDYPVSTLYPVYSGIPVTLNVTADCNCTDRPTCPTGGKIDEVDEYNNTLSKDTFVYNNGYKSKNFDCNLTEEPLTLFEEDQFYGGVVYNVSGTKNYPFDPDETDTRVHHIDIPAGMTVKKARLYVYWYDYWGNPPPGCLANLSVNFSNTIVQLDAAYTDQKGFGTYNTPKGTYAYDVTPQVTPGTAGSNDYTVIVTNIDPTNQTTLLGEMLLVVYEDPAGLQNHIHLWIMEGCDYLMASHGTYQYCVDVNESTATVTFPGPIPPAATGARLITVVSQGLADGANKLFNGNIVHTNAWNDMPASKINVDEEVLDVSQLVPADNTVGFQDTGTNGMQASNAILILEKGVVEKPDLVIEKKWEKWRGKTDKYKVYFVVKNIGTATAPRGHHATLSVDGEEIEHKLIRRALRPGKTYKSSFKTRVECTGDFDTVKVCADDFDFVDESDETNNCRENEWICEMVGKPDLVIEDIWTRERRDRCKVGFVVRNIGTVTAPCCHYATLFVNGEPMEEKHVRKALRPGRSYKGYFKTKVSCTDVIKVCADNFDVVDESDENNNCLEYNDYNH